MQPVLLFLAATAFLGVNKYRESSRVSSALVLGFTLLLVMMLYSRRFG